MVCWQLATIYLLLKWQLTTMISHSWLMLKRWSEHKQPLAEEEKTHNIEWRCTHFTNLCHMLDDLVLHQWWLWIITMSIFIIKIIITMIKIIQWQALHTKIKLLSFLLRSSRRTLIFSQASPIKVQINMYCTLLPCMVSINGFHGYAPAKKSLYSPKPLG